MSQELPEDDGMRCVGPPPSRRRVAARGPGGVVIKVHCSYDVEIRKYDDDDNEIELTEDEVKKIEADLLLEVLDVQNMDTDLSISVFMIYVERIA